MSTVLNIWAGDGAATPLPPDIMETFESVEVELTDQGFSGFQLNFMIGRNKMTGRSDYKALTGSVFKMFNRVIIFLMLDGRVQVLMDGVITNHQLNPGSKPGTGMLTVTGMDVSVMMDLEEIKREHVRQSESVIANRIIADYSRYGIIPEVIPPKPQIVPLPIEWVPVQRGTDYRYLEQMASRFNYKLYWKPGPAPGVSTFYWGPPVRSGVPQPAISVNMRQGSNADSINFTNNGLGPTTVENGLQEERSEKGRSVDKKQSTMKTLSKKPSIDTLKHKRKSFLHGIERHRFQYAQAKGSAIVDDSVEKALTATGELNGFRYRHVLKAGELVGVRGVGDTFDGIYYVQSVTHSLRRGEYKQRFTVNREGTSTTTGTLPS